MPHAFDDLLRETARLHPSVQLELSQAADGARLADIAVAGQRLLAVLDPARPEHLSLYCDAGAIDEHRLAALGRQLLVANLALVDHGLGGWGIDPDSNHLVYVTGGHLATTTPTRLGDVIERLCAHVRHWQDALADAQMPPPPAPRVMSWMALV